MTVPNLYAWDGTQWVNTGPIVGPQGATGPQGDQGPQGEAATISVGTVTSVNPDEAPNVINSGTSSESVLDFDLPRAPDFSVGSVVTGSPESSASVVNVGAGGDIVLDFSIPQGEQGIQGIQGEVGPQGPSGAPTGSIMMFGGSSSPSGWLLCDGAAVSRATFSALFSVVGTSFGAGNGSTTFNIPDMRLKFARGAGTGASVGSAGGSDSHGHGNVDATISINHSHNVSVNTSGNTDSVPNHQHITTQSGISGNTSAVVANVASNTFNVSRASGNLATAGSGHGHTASSHSHGPGNIVVTRNDPQSGGHSHNVSTSGSGNTSNTGGNRSISAPTASVPSIPSYTTVNYIIKT